MTARVDISSARLCRDCTCLVTTKASCPLCGQPTEEHHESKEVEGFCLGCAEGPFPACDLHVVTWEEDPYVQIDDGGLYYLCNPCRAAEASEEE